MCVRMFEQMGKVVYIRSSLVTKLFDLYSVNGHTYIYPYYKTTVMTSHLVKCSNLSLDFFCSVGGKFVYRGT